jgi:hypothetical protein
MNNNPLYPLQISEMLLERDADQTQTWSHIGFIIPIKFHWNVRFGSKSEHITPKLYL